MSMIATAGANNQAIFCPAEGVSEESEKIKERMKNISAERRRPVSLAWRESLLDEVWTILRACSEPGWDGYDGEPIRRDSGIRAKQLIEVLPEGIQLPRVIPE